MIIIIITIIITITITIITFFKLFSAIMKN